jgi:hypothetical protein
LSPILLSENLSRFIFKREYIRSNNKGHWRAFEPPGNLRMSVYRTSDISEGEIWDFGENVAMERGKPLKGRVDIAVSSVKKNGLDVVPDASPSRHANIINWPERKEEKMEIAMRLADASQGYRKE